MKLYNRGQSIGGHSVTTPGNPRPYSEKVKAVPRDQDGIEIDPEYEPAIVEQHAIDRNRLSGTAKASRTAPTQPKAVSDQCDERADRRAVAKLKTKIVTELNFVI